MDSRLAPATEKIYGLTHSLVGQAQALENSIVVFKFVHGQWVFLQWFDPGKPSTREPIPLFLKKGHFTTMDLKLGSRNIGSSAKVRTLDRLFPFWEGEKRRPAKYVNQVLAAVGCAHRLNQIS